MSDDERKKRPIDDAFWAAWLACEHECLKYAFRFCKKNAQRALELRDKAFDAVINDERPWREGTELEHHVKGCIKSIASNEGTSQSELVLRKRKAQRDPDPAAPDRSPLEHAIDNEETAIFQAVLRDVRDNARAGSLEEGYLRERAQGVEDLKAIAEHLGVTYRQVVDVQKGVRRKAKELLEQRGYALGDEEEDEDDGDES